MASYRHIARIAVMQSLFAYEFRGGDPMGILKYNLEEHISKLKDLSFAENLLQGTLQKKEEIIKIIQQEAPEWPVEKIAPVDRAILEMGTYEIMYCEEIPPIVAINEAVEVAKSFGDTNSPKFVNGVLSTIMHKYRPPHTEQSEVRTENNVAKQHLSAERRKKTSASKNTSPKSKTI